MRVIAGSARGKPLRAPKKAATRPTSDLVKGVLFSMLEAEAYKRGFEPDEDGRMAAGLAWPRVVDLFAGSGALGIEALSRGATHADFVEHDREAAQIIEANLRATGLREQASLLVQPADVGLRRVAGPIDLVLADPPYDDPGALDRALDALARPGLLSPSSVLALEHGVGARTPEHAGPLVLLRTRMHGKTRVSLYGAPRDAEGSVDRRVPRPGIAPK